MRLYTGFQRAVASLASSGIDVILYEVLLYGSEDQRRWDEALGDLPCAGRPCAVIPTRRP